jgi:hypothetical protein
MRDNKQKPEFSAEIALPRFIWPFTTDYHVKTGQKRINRDFWEDQKEALAKFDRENPGKHRPANMKPAVRPKLPRPPHQVMVAGGSKVPVPAPSQAQSRPPASPTPDVRPTPVAETSTVTTPRPAMEAGPSKQTKPVGGDAVPGPSMQARISKRQKPGAGDKAPGPGPGPAIQAGPSKHPKPVSGVGLMVEEAPKRRDKGKAKAIEIIESSEEDDEYVDEHMDTTSDRDGESVVTSEEEETPAPAPVTIGHAGPSKTHQDVLPNVSQGDRKRTSPKPSGRLHKPPCVRCVKSGRKCEVQTGVGKACVFCARVKMKCIPVSEDSVPGQTASKVRVIDGPKMPAQAPAQAQAPTKAPETSKPARTKAPAPAPAPVQETVPTLSEPSPLKRTKVTKKTMTKSKPAKAKASAPVVAKPAKRAVVTRSRVKADHPMEGASSSRGTVHGDMRYPKGGESSEGNVVYSFIFNG